MRSTGKRSLMMARETAMPTEVPNACTPRPTISHGRLCAVMPIVAPISTMLMPARTAVRRP